jgi:hypothetical protein
MKEMNNMKMADFIEGKKYRVSGWEDGYYIVFRGNSIFTPEGKDEMEYCIENQFPLLTCANAIRDDWEEYQENKELSIAEAYYHKKYAMIIEDLKSRIKSIEENGCLRSEEDYLRRVIEDYG